MVSIVLEMSLNPLVRATKKPNYRIFTTNARLFRNRYAKTT